MGDKEKTFKCLSQVEHVLQRPSIYIGDVRTSLMSGFVWDSSGRFVWKTDVRYNAGLVKIINEVIDNAYDNSIVEVNATTKIDVSIVGNKVTVVNNGQCIPLKKMDGTDEWIGTIVFGKLLSGSNFDDDVRGGIGMNGMGVKLSNIFSRWFNVYCFDPSEKKTFVGCWKKNMSEENVLVTSERCLNGGMTTKVMFEVDSGLFGGVGADEMIPWIQSRLVEIAHTKVNERLKITFNGKLIPSGGLKQLMKLFGNEYALYKRVGDEFEYGVARSVTDGYCHSSFVNGLRTSSSESTHTRFVTQRIVEVLKEQLSKVGGVGLSGSVVRSKLHVFVNLRVIAPEFSSQMKNRLTSPMSGLSKLDSGPIVGFLKKSNLLSELEAMISKKSDREVSRALNGTKRGTVVVDKYDGAKYAGTSKSSLCRLYLVEGDSAKTMFTVGASVIGREYNGVFPVRGKLLNVRGASACQLKKNVEIKNLMKILGLRMEMKYKTESELNTLRYGRLCIMVDADSDGSHISGLLINFIAYYWPYLLEIGYLKRFVTPIIKACKKGSDALFFFNQAEYEVWANGKNLTPYEITHLKGLGTSERSDTVRYFKDIGVHLKDMVSTESTLEYTDNIFNPKKSDWRKGWLTRCGIDQVESLDYKKSRMTIDEFYNSELFVFSQMSLVRSIPSVVDGLKKSQRQVVCGALYHFGKTGNKQYKVAQLAGIVAAHTKYAHGEVSLQECIVGMCQEFTGSNNLALLRGVGAFGSRMQNGKDAASARYIYTCLSDCVRKLFTSGDDAIVRYRVEEGQRVEPYYYVPTVPLLLVNGAHGIATGYRTHLPCFKLEDVVDMVRKRMNGEDVVEPLPWYDGYSTNHLTKNSDTKWIFSGHYTKCGLTVTIDELPIGYSIDGYKNGVLMPLMERGVLGGIESLHVDENRPVFKVRFVAECEDVIGTLKLTSTIGKTCLNFLDRDGVIKTYGSIVEIVDDWLAVKLEYTEKRRLNMIVNLEEKQEYNKWRVRYIESVKTEVIPVFERKAVVLEKMREVGIPSGYTKGFLDTPIHALSYEKVIELKRTIAETAERIEYLKSSTREELYMKDLDVFGPSEHKRKCDVRLVSSKKKRL